MAQLVRRARRSDGITTVQVKWRLAGRRSAWQSETFAAGTSAQHEARAAAFQADVEEAGNRWPVGWTRGWATTGRNQTFMRLTRPLPWSPWRRSPPTTSSTSGAPTTTTVHSPRRLSQPSRRLAYPAPYALDGKGPLGPGQHTVSHTVR
jgi:hypothetical protein